jgi:iron complex outermembrane recepter protein
MDSTSYRSSTLFFALLGTALAGSLLTATPAVAQNTQSQDQTGTLGEVVVTAQFRQQKVQDTPIAITAVDAALLEARSQTNLAQVADNAPNVTFRPQGASFGPSITASIRGVGQNDFNPAFEPGVGIYIDDVYFPSLTGAVFDLLDLDRVEILRGPQGTLAGRNSEGGAIKLYSKKPSGENGGYVEATAGSRDRIGLRASGDFTLSDTVSARISGVYKRQDGYVDQVDFGCAHPAGSDPLNPAGGIPRTQAIGDCVVGKLGGIGYEAARAMLRFKPNENFDLILSADATHDQHTIAGEVLLATGAVANTPNTYAVTSNPNVHVPYGSRFICGPYCNYATLSQPAITFHGVATPPAGVPLLATSGSNISVYDGYDLGSNLHWRLTDALSIDNILAYQHYKTTWDSDDDLSPTNLNLGHNVQRHWNWSEELRLNAKLSDSVNAVLGGYYFKQSTDYWSYQDIRYLLAAFPLFPLQFIQPDSIPANSKAAFANVGWEIAHNLNLNAGVRYTKESKEYHYFRLNPDGTVDPFLDPVGSVYGIGYNGPDTLGRFGGGTVKALSGSVAHYEGSKTDYRAALDYRFSPEVMVYASVSTGFKGGGTNPRPFNAGQVISFNPETLTNFEAGIKSDLFGRRLRVNLTGFYSKVKDVQIPVLACPDSPCAARLNAGDADSKGIEIELEARPVDAFTVDASFSYLDFHFTTLSPAAAYPTNPAGASLDDPPAGVPKQKFTLGMQYEIALGNAGSLTPRVDADYQDKIYTGPDVEGSVRNLTFMPSYTLVNARVMWRNAKKDVDVALECTNLTDKYYYLSVFDLRGAGAGFDKAQPGRPREWALMVKKKFAAN